MIKHFNQRNQLKQDDFVAPVNQPFCRACTRLSVGSKQVSADGRTRGLHERHPLLAWMQHRGVEARIGPNGVRGERGREQRSLTVAKFFFRPAERKCN